MNVSIKTSQEDQYTRATVSLEATYGLRLPLPTQDLVGEARSYSEMRAIAYALEDLALKILKAVGR